jgi:hypothetical protein
MQATVRRAAFSVRPFAMVCAVALAVCTAADWAAGNTRPAPGSADGDGLLTSAPQILVIFSDDLVAVASSAIAIDRKQRAREHDARAPYEQLTPREREVFALNQRTAQ